MLWRKKGWWVTDGGVPRTLQVVVDCWAGTCYKWTNYFLYRRTSEWVALFTCEILVSVLTLDSETLSDKMITSHFPYFCRSFNFVLESPYKFVIVGGCCAESCSSKMDQCPLSPPSLPLLLCSGLLSERVGKYRKSMNGKSILYKSILKWQKTTVGGRKI